MQCTLVLTLVSPPWLQITQLYEMISVRHGLMLVGAPFSGKSVGLKLLAGALTDLNAEGKQGTLFEKVEMRVINPKSVTMGQLYGEVDRATQEWKVSSCNSAVPHASCLNILFHMTEGDLRAAVHLINNNN